MENLNQLKAKMQQAQRSSTDISRIKLLQRSYAKALEAKRTEKSISDREAEGAKIRAEIEAYLSKDINPRALSKVNTRKAQDLGMAPATLGGFVAVDTAASPSLVEYLGRDYYLASFEEARGLRVKRLRVLRLVKKDLRKLLNLGNFHLPTVERSAKALCGLLDLIDTPQSPVNSGHNS